MAGSASRHDKANPGFLKANGGGGKGWLPAMSRQKKNCIGQKIKKLLIDVACSIKTAKY